ncbi:ribose 5-phosphate isomerase A [Virgibacillus natechei]|uniref:Ribose-5-phosphate isomerase A n=1 Tax=Virgibacillus natechei TaxID=1216297 RepID=A0ABS4IL23_9BACI|nr:ribose-5-phosphate isomerase RpiA [Virgibacillus natechei]MBP1970704.1 ribose 5-phosphate isomerase A [Virgibacillus natechei]
MSEMDNAKKLVGEEAVKYIEDGMKVGLGSGSTVYWMIKKLGEYVEQGLDVTGVPTSQTTAQWAKEFGIPLTDFSELKQLDVTIDGADEVDENLHLIKGGGGALLREKIVASAAKELIIIVDRSKKVAHLGAFPLPVEVIPFGWEVTANNISTLGCVPKLRQKDGEVFISDNGNYILDCPFDKIPNPKTLHKELKSLVGVVETGLFVGMTDKVIVGEGDEVEVISKG